VTRLALLAALVALVAVAPADAAISARIAAKPSPAVVGAKTTLSVRVTTGAAQTVPKVLYLKLVSPAGAALRVRLTRGGGSLWRTSFVFLNKGNWRLRVVAGAGGSPKPGSVLGASRLVVR